MHSKYKIVIRAKCLGPKTLEVYQDEVPRPPGFTILRKVAPNGTTRVVFSCKRDEKTTIKM